MIVVADTDLLSDRMWVQVQDFFGQRIPQPWADNASFVINSLDNLSGSDALISVRSRGRFSRPFEVVDSACSATAESQASVIKEEPNCSSAWQKPISKLAEPADQSDDPGKVSGA